MANRGWRLIIRPEIMPIIRAAKGDAMNVNGNGRWQNTLTQIKQWANAQSLWMVHFNGGSCVGCDLEIAALQSPRYESELEQFGLRLGKNPCRANMLLCTGVVTRQSEPALREIYEEMRSDTQVVAVGTCAVARNIFKDCYNVVAQVDEVLPVDLYIPGCPPRPQAILAGLRKLQTVSSQRIEIGRPVSLMNGDAFRFQNGTHDVGWPGGFG